MRTRLKLMKQKHGTEDVFTPPGPEMDMAHSTASGADTSLITSYVVDAQQSAV